MPARRNLTPYARSLLALQLEPLLAADGKARMQAGGGDRKKVIAAAAGVSHDTIAKVKVIEAKAPA